LKKYGKTREDKKAEKSIKCREIVGEIVKFGVDESQKLQIIKLLALELENNKNMKRIVNAISKIAENDSESNENTGLLGL